MSTQVSKVIAANAKGNGDTFSVRSIGLDDLGERASPLALLDDFRVSGRPFPPHPHAGFSANTYVFEDSEAGLRSRDSLGGDTVVGPGGIVWTQAGSGVLHEEMPAKRGRELHGLQFFVNLSAKNKHTAPKVLALDRNEVPEWRDNGGDRVRVVVGSYQGFSSPLAPTEPFEVLDVHLKREISLGIAKAHNALVYVASGTVIVRADGREQKVTDGHALALHGGGGRVTFAGSANFVVLSGAELREPVLMYGSFIMNDRAQAEAAVARYQSGRMGHLEPASDW